MSWLAQCGMRMVHTLLHESGNIIITVCSAGRRPSDTHYCIVGRPQLLYSDCRFSAFTTRSVFFFPPIRRRAARLACYSSNLSVSFADKHRSPSSNLPPIRRAHTTHNHRPAAPSYRLRIAPCAPCTTCERSRSWPRSRHSRSKRPCGSPTATRR